MTTSLLPIVPGYLSDSSMDSGRNGCSQAPVAGRLSRLMRGSGSRNTPGISSRSTNVKISEFTAQLVCSWNPKMVTGMPSSASSVRSSRKFCPSALATMTPRSTPSA